MLGWRRKDKTQGDVPPSKKKLPVINASLQDVREAVRAFADNAPKGVYSSILVKEDNTIDYELLAPYLHGIPERKLYMSRATYEIFEEDECEICVETDKVQAAVDAYVKETGELPYIEGDPYRKVSYYKLESRSLLSERPSIDFYLTDEEFLITHRKPR
ncbi:DUF3939 domain-containing protein [Bacillus marinisedimentorum]|uniref:DUF3939 domain-containing protein n=1 Tax=Bacillus marinisedimentorum TaxID=1821260 RepID=UPI000873267F|nr:DUF3939 domain-containing protein [Bacillus marinisedimentorum]